MIFGNPVVAGVVLIREAIRSPNYVAGVGRLVDQPGRLR
jgi:hypothetical protein